MADPHKKSQMLEVLRRMLRDMIELRRSGAAYPRLARAHGYIDGYMRALLEAGVAEQAELLALVGDVRTKVEGPATGVLSSEVVA